MVIIQDKTKQDAHTFCTKHPERQAVRGYDWGYFRKSTFFCQQCLDNGKHKKHPDYGRCT